MKVIYLSGAPASGKSTFSSRIKEIKSNIEVISYSDLLQDYIQKKKSKTLTKIDLREKSSMLITPDDIDSVDSNLVDLINRKRTDKHVIVDSHAVTNEVYGFRATPFKLSILKSINFDLLISLYSSTDSIQRRIQKKPDGRKTLDSEELIFSIDLQNSLVMTYSIMLDKPAYFLNTDNDMELLVNWISQKLSD
jgi:adenylate kinase